eukprot:SAG31_NODE_8218_length_1494_cov_1.539068_1_plen_54_part_00
MGTNAFLTKTKSAALRRQNKTDTGSNARARRIKEAYLASAIASLFAIGTHIAA